MSIRARQRNQADRVGESHHAVEHLQLAVFSKRTEKSNYARPIKRCSYWHQAPGVMRRVYLCFHSLYLCPFYQYTYGVRTCMRRPGRFPVAWSSLAFTSRQFLPKIVGLSVRCVHILFSMTCTIFILMSERSGERKPPAERSALYILYIRPRKETPGSRSI